MFQYPEHSTFVESKSSLCYDRTTRTSTDYDSDKGRKRQPHEFCKAGWWSKPRGGWKRQDRDLLKLQAEGT